MFCYQCGQQIPAGGRFCPNCGTAAAGAAAPAPAAAPPPPPPAPVAPPPPVYPTPPPVAYAPPPPPPAPAPAYWTPPAAPPPAAPAAPPAAPAPAAPAAAPAYWTPPPAVAPPPVYAAPPPPPPPPPPVEPTTEKLIYYESAVRTKVPGKLFWNHDILVTERRLIARKTGWKGNLTKGMARSAAGGLVNALAATALLALESGMSQVKTPKFADAPVVAVEEVDEFRDKADGAVEFRFDELARCVFRKRGFVTPATLVLQSPQGELQTEVNFFKELKPILQSILGSRCADE